MKLPSTAYLIVGIVLAVVIGYAVIRDLTTDASAAAAFCTKAQQQNVPCTPDPKQFTAQVVVITDATGAKLGYLIVSDGSKQVAVIPLQ